MANNPEQRDLLRQLIAGLFFLLCLGLIGGAVFVIGTEKGLTQPKFTMTAIFHKVGGLSEGAPVRLSGVTVGTVANIDFLDEAVNGRSVRVELSLYEKYRRQLHKATKIGIITEGVLGEKIVEITTDSAFFRPDLGVPVIGEDPIDVQTIAEAFGDSARALQDASQSFENISKEVDTIFRTMRRLLNRLEQRLIDGNLFKVF